MIASTINGWVRCPVILGRSSNPKMTMKTMCRTLAVTVLAILMGLTFRPASHAQEIIAIAPQDAPRQATYFVLVDSNPTTGRRLIAPYPCVPPGDGTIYQASQYRDDIFLVDQRASQQVDAELLSALVALRIQIAAASATTLEPSSSEMSLMSEGGPPLPGEGEGGTNSGGGTYEFDGPTYGTNDLWIEAGISNSLLSIVIHPPTGGTNSCWDVLGTTNLTLATPMYALNLTNWAWIYHSADWETNIVLTNLWPDMGFFRLGTMQDTDNDGLTDAVEILVSHSNLQNPDSDGDSVGDLQEFLQGTDPNRADSDGDGFKDIAFALNVTQPAANSPIP
jgi:hypothetical protein